MMRKKDQLRKILNKKKKKKKLRVMEIIHLLEEN